jgi:D-alanyl-D-alanine carboxypeptidase
MIELYLILSLVFSGLGFSHTSAYFDNLARQDFSVYQKQAPPVLVTFKASNIYPWGIKQTGLEPKVNAKAAIAVDIDNGQTVFSYNEDNKLAMASLTKIMTATVALERINDFNVPVTISRNAALVEGSRMNLWIDEKISLKDILYGLILKSGNDAAVTLEEYYDNVVRPKTSCSSQTNNSEIKDPSKKEVTAPTPGFVELMNQKANDLGLKDMKFEDSSGISENNTTSPKDLVSLIDYAMRNPVFKEVMSTQQYTASALNGALQHPMTTTNRLLRTRTDVLGGKTGYSEAAGYNMITVFKSPAGHRIVTIVFGTEGNDARFNESNKIIDWVYNYYRY